MNSKHFINIYIDYNIKNYKKSFKNISNIIYSYSIIDECNKCKNFTFNGNKKTLKCLLCNNYIIFCFCEKKFNNFDICILCWKNKFKCNCCFFCQNCNYMYCCYCYCERKKKYDSISFLKFNFNYITTCSFCKKKVCHKCNIKCMNEKYFCDKMLCTKCSYNYNNKKYCLHCFENIIYHNLNNNKNIN